ncbi:glycerate kinase [Pseudomonas qingdaonensis]|nr:glycerate kinase [Pseudomonas qingdaonensis]
MRGQWCLGDLRPAKGASPAQVALLDHALGHFADHCAGLLEEDVRAFPGCGAAGGMGFAAKAFMGAQFRAGVEVVAELAGLEAAVRGADLVITGEGASMRRPCAARPVRCGAHSQASRRAGGGDCRHPGRGATRRCMSMASMRHLR